MNNVLWFAIGILAGFYLPLVLGRAMVWDERRRWGGRRTHRMSLNEILNEIADHAEDGDDDAAATRKHRDDAA